MSPGGEFHGGREIKKEGKGVMTADLDPPVSLIGKKNWDVPTSKIRK